MPTVALSDYRVLAAFRFEIRKFLAFSEKAAREAGVEPQQHQLMLAVKGLPAEQRPTIRALADRLCVEHHTTVALVDKLHEAGTPLYLLSNAPALLDPWLRGAARRRHPFLGHFRDYVVSGLVGHCKPDRAIYDLACRTGPLAEARLVVGFVAVAPDREREPPQRNGDEAHHNDPQHDAAEGVAGQLLECPVLAGLLVVAAEGDLQCDPGDQQVRDAVAEQPWLPNGPIPTEVTWSLVAKRSTVVRDEEDHDHGALA